MLGQWQAAWQGWQVACLCSCLQLVLDSSFPAQRPVLQMMIGCFVCGWLMRRFGRPAGIQACGLFNIVGAVVQVCGVVRGVAWRGGAGRGVAGWGGVGWGGVGWGGVGWGGVAWTAVQACHWPPLPPMPLPAYMPPPPMPFGK